MSQMFTAGFLEFANQGNNLTSSLFHSEGYFWLTNSIAISAAAEELVKFKEIFPEIFDESIKEVSGSKEMISLFNHSIKQGNVDKQTEQRAKQCTISNANILKKLCEGSMVFQPEKGVVLGKAFATYWLIFKLIELEWQQVLELEEVNETYQFLDTVIMDHEELDEMSKLCQNKQALDMDSLVYLKSNWERVRFFWPKLYNDLSLVADGWIKYIPQKQ